MDNIRMSAYVCRVALRKAFRTPKTYIAVLWVLFIFLPVTQNLKYFCASIGMKSSPWLFPFMTNDDSIQMFIILGALLLFCDAPFLNQNGMWQIMRAGRKNWFWGNISYIWGISLIYTLVLSVLPVLLVWPQVEMMPGWGKVLGSIAQTSAASQAGIAVVDYSVMVYFTPIQAMLLTVLAVWLNTVLVGMVNYSLNLIVKNGLGAVVSVVIGLSPLLFNKLIQYYIGYYLSPPMWMALNNYNLDSYGYRPGMTYIYSVLLGAIGICTIFSYLSIKKKDLNFSNEV